MSSVLCEASVNFAVGANRFAKAAAEICDPNTIESIGLCIFRATIVIITRMGQVEERGEG